MLFVDLLRVTVLLIAGVATALGTVTAIAASQDSDVAVLVFAGVLWVAAAALGLGYGRSARAVEAMSQMLSGARTATSLPTETAARIAFLRLWPIGGFALGVGGLAWIWPQVAAIGTASAILTALAWRNRERAVVAIEERDGVRFYVEPTSAIQPMRLVRTAGLRRDMTSRR